MQGFDLKGAAHDADLRAARWSRLLIQYPSMMRLYKLVTRNPWVAEDTARFVQQLVQSRPEHARSPNEPLFPKAS